MAQEEFRHETIAPGAKKDVVFLLFSDSHDVVGAHWHDEVELILITRGTLLAQLQGRGTKLEAGDMLIVNSGIVHATNGSMGNDSILLEFPKRFLLRYIPDFDECWFDLDTHNEDPRHQTKLAMLRTVLENMAVVQDVSPEGGNLRFTSLLFEVLYELYHNFRVPFPKEHEKGAGDIASLYPVLDYTKVHYQERICVSEAAGILHLQEEYFCRKFKKLMGMTYLDYLSGIRLTHIYDGLLHTDLSLAQILENNGFTNYKLFRKLFRDSYGCTPGELRKKNRGSAEKIIRVASEKGLYSRDLTDQEGVRVL